ncbi:Charged multivesicular body protein 7 [Rhynchospora pubera]|uniref:Charged multivesicular body protein 7 n=1 Tax=Rhynchospora pubera TaxID=906938 RepID=A0AAV8GNV7_9POAL|nr:Charged multivesicular body protein 7 [Rhynchospora pubera]
MAKSGREWESVDGGWEEVVRAHGGVNWDDDAAWDSGRMKALSGQRSDWEPLFLFWRRLILLVASRLRISLIPASRVKSVWFRRRSAVSPLSIPQVLHEMHSAGDILILGEDVPLVDLATGSSTSTSSVARLSGVLTRFARAIGVFATPSLNDDDGRDHFLIFKPVLQQKISEVVSTLKEGHWTSTCVLTITQFQSLFDGNDEASVALSFLSPHGNARYLSVSFKDGDSDAEIVQGVKLSLGTAPVGAVSSLDYDLLKLVWTEEKLQKHIDLIDRSWESSRKKALECFKSGNREAALRHIRRSKLLANSREKSGQMLERVEQLLRLLADAEATNKVAEAIKIGAKAMKEQSINIEEVHHHMEELDYVVSAFNDVQAALESVPLKSGDIEDEEFEEELEKLEAELLKEEEGVQETEMQEKQGSQAQGPRQSQSQSQAEELADSVCHNLSKLNLEPEAA